MKKTLLEYVTSKGYEKPESYIRAGQVYVNSNIEITPSTLVDDDSIIVIKEKKEWVSRGAYKLLQAIDFFKIDFTNKVVLDIGSSTGGFTQVALEHGAKKIYALDVGTNQLDYNLRINPKICVYEKTNLKSIKPSMFKKKIDIIVTDVSFISLKHVFNKVKNLNSKIIIMALIKPQFEANSNQVLPGGFVPEELHEEIIEKIKSYALIDGFIIKKIIKSNILGNKSKNQEYLTYIERYKDE